MAAAEQTPTWRIPAGLDERYRLAGRIPQAERPVVFVGPYEHHSSELPWRESIPEVVVIAGSIRSAAPAGTEQT